MLAEGSVQRNACKASSKDEAGQRDVQVSWSLLAVLLLFFHLFGHYRVTLFGEPEGPVAQQRPDYCSLQYFGKHLIMIINSPTIWITPHRFHYSPAPPSNPRLHSAPYLKTRWTCKYLLRVGRQQPISLYCLWIVGKICKGQFAVKM